MKWSALFVIFIVMFSLPVLAQEEADEENAGVTPDSFWWGIDVALEKIGLALTFDNKARAEKGLEIARERLSEIRLMADEKNIKALAKAETEHGKIFAKIEEDIDELEEENNTEEITDIIELESEIENHENKIKEFKQKVDIKIKGELTAEQQAMINDALASLDENVRELKIRVDNKKGSTRIKIKTKTGQTEVEIEKEISKIERDVKGLKEEYEVKAKIFGNQSQAKLKLEFESEIMDEEALINKIIEDFSLDDETANSMLEISDDEESLEEDRLKIEAEIKDGFSEVKVELRFTIGSVERNAIVAAIVEESQLTREDIESVWDLKFKSKKEDDDNETEDDEDDDESEDDEDEIECATDADCEEGRMCIEGECEDEENEKDSDDEKEGSEDEIECSTDADCDEGKSCVEGDCESDSSNESGDSEESNDELECTTDADCEADEVCVENDCEDKD